MDIGAAVEWLLQGILNLIGWLVGLAVEIIKWIVMLFPATGPGLPIAPLPDHVNFSWMGAILDFNAFALALQFIFAVETVWFVAGIAWRAWQAIKW